MRTHNLGGRGACLWFLFALFLAETLEKKEPIQTELSFGVLYECDVQLDYFFISGAEIIIFLMTLVNSAKNLVYLQNMYFFTCMMQKLPFSWSLYCWMLIIFGRIVWNLFMWNVYYMYLHLHFVHVQCICQQDCKVLLIYQHRVQERKKKDYKVFWWYCYFNVLY